eukprot:Opistho-1_new@28283
MVVPGNTRVSTQYRVVSVLVKLFIVGYFALGLPPRVLLEFGVAVLGIYVAVTLWTGSDSSAPARERTAQSPPAKAPPAQDVRVQEALDACALSRNESLDLSPYALSKIPPTLAAFDHVRRLTFEMPLASASFVADPLTAMRGLDDLTITGAPLTGHVLDVVSRIEGLRHLRLANCRCVVQETNTAAGCVTPSEFFAFQQRLRRVDTIEVPEACYFPVGTLDRMFGEKKVAVLALTRRVAVGDVIAFSHTNHKDFASAHVERTEPTLVREIRTDDHRLLTEAGYEGCADDERLVAVMVAALGRKRDRVLWMGRQRTLLQ